MENKNLESSLKETLVSLQHYVDLQIRYNKLLLAKRMGEISSVFALFMILLIIFSFAIFFLSFSFVSWFAAQTGNRYYGDLIVFGFYLLVGIVLIIFRERIIFGPVRNLFANIFTSDDYEENNDHYFQSKESINNHLHNYKESIREEEADLKEKIDNLNNVFTFPNVLQSISKSFYKTYLNTSNIAKVSYFLVRKIKSGISKNKTKKERKKQQQLEDGDD